MTGPLPVPVLRGSTVTLRSHLATVMVPSAQLSSWAIEVGGEYAGTIDLRRLAVDAGPAHWAS